MKPKVTVILTCFNRKEKTLLCIRTLVEGNPLVCLSFIVVDDSSSDGTSDDLEKTGYDIRIIKGNGTLFWSGGMRMGIGDYLSDSHDSQYVLLVNDDVTFFENIILKLIKRSQENKDAVVVGATCDKQGKYTYGALKLVEKRKRDLYFQVHPQNEIVYCDTFNANCVLIKNEILKDVGNFDEAYKHSLADLDYGFTMTRKGYHIISSSDYIGICEKNSIKGTWMDTSLTRRQRLEKKEGVKGAPIKPWFYFMKKNFGIRLAVRYSITPYIKILLGK